MGILTRNTKNSGLSTDSNNHWATDFNVTGNAETVPEDSAGEMEKLRSTAQRWGGAHG